MRLQVFAAILVATVSIVLILPLVMKAAARYGLLDTPFSAPHKTHKYAVPKAGGIAIGIVVFLISLSGGRLMSSDVPVILLASAVVLLFGIWDDAQGLSALWKLSGQVLAGIILILGDIHIHIFTSDVLNIAVTLLWIIGITNAFNLVDSMDGLAVGLGGITAAFLTIGAFDAGQESLALFGAVLVGSCIGVFYFNSSPPLLFLGDAGSQFLGVTLASVAIIYTPPQLPQASSWFVPILLFAVPIFDTTLVTFSRLRRKVPFYKARRDHTFHRLVAFGMSPYRAVITMHLGAVLIDCLAFVALFLPPIWSNVIFGSMLVAAGIALFWLESKAQPEELTT